MFFTLTNRASTIPANIRDCQSGTWSAGQKISEELLQSFDKIMKPKQNRNGTRKGIITQSTCHKNIEEGHSIEKAWYSASCEPSHTLPRLQSCTQTDSIYNSVLSGVQASLSAQSTSLKESLGWSNQRGSKTSLACYSHPRFNIVRLLARERGT